VRIDKLGAILSFKLQQFLMLLQNSAFQRFSPFHFFIVVGNDSNILLVELLDHDVSFLALTLTFVRESSNSFTYIVHKLPLKAIER